MIDVKNVPDIFGINLRVFSVIKQNPIIHSGLIKNDKIPKLEKNSHIIPF